MNVSEPVGPLNEILHVLARSLPSYLYSARPWSAGAAELIPLALATLARDQQRYAHLVADAVVDVGGHPSPGAYAREFCGLNDLDAGYLLGRVIERHACDIELIRRCCHALHDSPAHRDLADEILGNAQGHLEVLEELLGPG
jgi:hypothetical protein